MIYLTRKCAAPTAVRFCQTTWYNDYYFWSIIVYNYEIISLIVCTKSTNSRIIFPAVSRLPYRRINYRYIYKSESQIDTTNHAPTLLHPTYLVHTSSTVHQQYSIFFKFSTYVGIIFLPISIAGSTPSSTYVYYRTNSTQQYCERQPSLSRPDLSRINKYFAFLSPFVLKDWINLYFLILKELHRIF